jgi:hypothetical protein
MTDYEDDQLKEENARKQRDMAQREIDDIRFVMSNNTVTCHKQPADELALFYPHQRISPSLSPLTD